MSIQSQIDEKCNCKTETAAAAASVAAFASGDILLRYSSFASFLFLLFFSRVFLRRVIVMLICFCC